MKPKSRKWRKAINATIIIDSMEKLHEPLKKRHFRIEKFIQNPGLQHIALAIFKNLDPKSLGNCRVVSKEWKACIDQEKYWWNLQLVKCKEIIEIAMTRNHIELVKLFLDRADELGINLNARQRENTEDFDRGYDGKTPIMYAVKPEVMKLLLADERINVNATDDEGHTILYHLCNCDFRFEVQDVLETITLLMSTSSRFDPTIDVSLLHHAVHAWPDFFEVILKSALAAGVDLNCRDEWDNLSLIWPLQVVHMVYPDSREYSFREYDAWFKVCERIRY